MDVHKSIVSDPQSTMSTKNNSDRCQLLACLMMAVSTGQNYAAQKRAASGLQHCSEQLQIALNPCCSAIPDVIQQEKQIAPVRISKSSSKPRPESPEPSLWHYSELREGESPHITLSGPLRTTQLRIAWNLSSNTAQRRFKSPKVYASALFRTPFSTFRISKSSFKTKHRLNTSRSTTPRALDKKAFD